MMAAHEWWTTSGEAEWSTSTVFTLLALWTGVLLLAHHSRRIKASAPLPPPTPSGAGQKSSSTKHPCPQIEPETVQQLLEARRSIFPKDYTGAIVEDALVRRLLDASRWAPSHGKLEPWRFVCYAGDGRHKLLNATLTFFRGKGADFWATAWDGEFQSFGAFEDFFRKQCDAKWLSCSHFVSICVRRQRPGEGKRRYPEHEEISAVACAVQNMHILATSMRIASYWSSWFDLFTESPEGVALHGLDAALGDRWIGVFCIGQSDKMDSYRATRRPVTAVAEWRCEQ
jgi:nitroreductase